MALSDVACDTLKLMPLDATQLQGSRVGRALIHLRLDDQTPADVAALTEDLLYGHLVASALDASSEGIAAAVAWWALGPSSVPASDVATQIAHAVVDAPASRWWAGRWDERDQIWLSDGSGPPDPARVPQPAKGKPPAGLWTSSAVAGLPSAWWPVVTRGILDLPDEVFAWKTAFRAGLRVFEIQAADDWNWLCGRFPAEPAELLRSRSQLPKLVAPDWNAVGREFDGVHLTAAGVATAQGVLLPLGEHVTMLWGWDAECTAWLTWPVEEMTLLGAVPVPGT